MKAHWKRRAPDTVNRMVDWRFFPPGHGGSVAPVAGMLKGGHVGGEQGHLHYPCGELNSPML